MGFHCCIKSGKWFFILLEMMFDEPLFVLLQNLGVAFQPVLDRLDDSASVKLGFRVGQLTVGCCVIQVIAKDHLDILVPFNDCGSEILVTLNHEELSLILKVVEGVTLMWQKVATAFSAAYQGFDSGFECSKTTR